MKLFYKYNKKDNSTKIGIFLKKKLVRFKLAIKTLVCDFFFKNINLSKTLLLKIVQVILVE